jgi:hypothetical protein
MNDLQPAIDFLKRRKHQIEVAIQALERVERSHGSSIVNPPAAGANPIKEPSGSGGIVSGGLVFCRPVDETPKHPVPQFNSDQHQDDVEFGERSYKQAREELAGTLPAKPDEN